MKEVENIENPYTDQAYYSVRIRFLLTSLKLLEKIHSHSEQTVRMGTHRIQKGCFVGCRRAVPCKFG